MTEQKTRFDFEVLRRAIEGSGADALISLYAEDAEVRIVSKNTPPSMPCLFRGKEAVAGMLRDVCSREMAHRVEARSSARIGYRSARRASIRTGRRYCPR